jgi:galactokinase/CTP:molybdopterin cytidylyltransferase MocA
MHGAEPATLEHLLAASPTSPRPLLLLLRRMYGASGETLGNQLRRLTSMCGRFLALYGDGPVNLLRAPARINILGEHVDYVSYLPTASLPFGSREYDMLMLYRAAPDGRVRGASAFEKYEPFVFDLADGPAPGVGGEAEGNWLSYLYENPAPAPHWGNYVKGAAFFARVRRGGQIRFGFDFVVDSSILPGGGASSSSALVVLAGAAVCEVNHVACAPEELARDAARAEWYVGTRGGAMDHTAICLARRQHAVLISYSEETARRVPLPGGRFRWVTFFSRAADKGREVMIEYNERAAVSRLIIPAVIEDWEVRQPERHRAWLQAVESFRAGSVAALDALEALLNELPQTLALAEIEQDYPETFSECARSFPALVREHATRPLRVRARGLHHLGEVRRIATATLILDGVPQPQSDADGRERTDHAMRSLGRLLNESHESLRDLYGVSTPEVEQLVEIIRADPVVYGARLMGGGFGGNVLALTTEENVSELSERVQAAYYAPQERQGAREGAVMISTPGDGLAPLDIESVWREAVERFNSLGQDATQYRASLAVMLDRVTPDAPAGEVWPVIVAAGKGTRARETGLDVPKPLANVLGVPAIVRVLRNVRAAAPASRPPVVIVSPETERAVRAALSGEELTFVLQPAALGTGDAVLCAREVMRGFQGRALVVWSTQPVIRPETMRRTLKLAALFPNHQMVFPTVLKARPYAPVLRDERGRVHAARETHLEMAERPPFGESNTGMFVLGNGAMFAALAELKRRHWDESRRRYERARNELGFPNELINYFCERGAEVLACPVADTREEQGIKNLDDVARCEQFISELQREQS